MPRDYLTEANALKKGEGIPGDAYEVGGDDHLSAGTSDYAQSRPKLGEKFVPENEIPDPATVNMEDEIIKTIDESVGESVKEKPAAEPTDEIRTYKMSPAEVDKMVATPNTSLKKPMTKQSSSGKEAMRPPKDLKYKGGNKRAPRGAERNYKGKQWQKKYDKAA